MSNLSILEIKNLDSSDAIEKISLALINPEVKELYIRGGDIEKLRRFVELPYITILDISNVEIWTLERLPKCPLLKSLNLVGCYIGEINMKNESFPNLIEVDLSNNLLRSLKGFPNTPKLKKLVVTNNKLRSFNSFPKYLLEYIESEHNFITSFNYFPNYPRLQQLRVSNNKITEVNLRPLKNLTELLLDNNEIQYIDNLECPKLKSLSLTSNKLEDVSFLHSISNTIESLYLENNKIFDISIFPIMPNLKMLCLSKNPIVNTSSMSRLENLEILYINDTRISTLHDLLSKSPNLKELNATNNPSLTEIDDLSKHTRLRNVNCDGCKISLFKKSDPSNIESLILNSNNFTDISSFPYFPSLKSLDLSNNKIRNASAIFEKIPNIELLNLSHNKIISVINLSNLLKLDTLDLSFNEIVYPWDMRNLPSLFTLRLNKNKINSAKDISVCPKNLCDLQNNNITSFEGLDRLLGANCTIQIMFNPLTDLKGIKCTAELLPSITHLISTNFTKDHLYRFSVRKWKYIRRSRSFLDARSVSLVSYKALDYVTNNFKDHVSKILNSISRAEFRISEEFLLNELSINEKEEVIEVLSKKDDLSRKATVLLRRLKESVDKNSKIISGSNDVILL